MKFISKAVVWIFWFLFGWIINWADNKIFIYKKRLQMVPTSFKWFIWFLGVIVGASGTMIYIQAPEIAHELTKASTPITYVNPAHAEVVPAPVVVETPKPVDLVDVIFSKESSRGVNNYSKCEDIGKYNRYGFNIPGDGTYICFDKDQDTVAVAGWVAHKKALGYSDKQLICLYNTGKATNDCPYAEGL